MHDDDVDVNRHRGCSLALAGVVALVGFGVFGHAQGRITGPGSTAGRGGESPRDPARELALKITAPFTFASVGDLILMRPASALADRGFQNAIKIVRDADLAFGNLETSLSDIPNFSGPLRGYMGTKDVAADLKAMGFDMVSRANNHVFDSNKDGMFETHALLDGAGIIYAGAGRNLEDARVAQMLETAKGRTALVAMAAADSQSNQVAPLETQQTGRQVGRLAATSRMGNANGRAGINQLIVTTSYVVSREQLAELKAIRNALATPLPGVSGSVPLAANETSDRVLMFGNWYEAGPTPGAKRYRMNPEDVSQILRSIRNGKYLSDFLIATIHAHYGSWAQQRWLFEDQTPDFLVDLGRRAVDNGADVFVAHGPHVVRGVEIYKGKPIFYGLGEFFRELDWATLDSAAYQQLGEDPVTTSKTSAEIMERQSRETGGRDPILFESVIALSSYDGGRLREVRLHPVDLGAGNPVSRTGIPRVAPPDVGRRILERLQVLSRPFGTTISIENNVGVIRVPAGTP